MASMTSPQGTVNNSPQPGLFIFTDRHYSMSMVTTAQPRPVVDNASASAPQLLAMYGQAFQAQSGQYSLKGNDVVLRPVVSKNPRLMSEGETQIYTFEMRGNTLTMTGPRGDGQRTYRLERVEAF